MRKLWPVYYDDLSLRVWSSAASICLTLIVVLLVIIPDGFWASFFLGAPGWLAFMAIAGPIEEADFNFWAILAGLLVNLGFYYLIARWMFAAFQPVRGWWPEKRT
jgi:hypothetical protein